MVPIFWSVSGTPYWNLCSGDQKRPKNWNQNGSKNCGLFRNQFSLGLGARGPQTAAKIRTEIVPKTGAPFGTNFQRGWVRRGGTISFKKWNHNDCKSYSLFQKKKKTGAAISTDLVKGFRVMGRAGLEASGVSVSNLRKLLFDIPHTDTQTHKHRTHTHIRTHTHRIHKHMNWQGNKRENAQEHRFTKTRTHTHTQQLLSI